MFVSVNLLYDRRSLSLDILDLFVEFAEVCRLSSLVWIAVDKPFKKIENKQVSISQYNSWSPIRDRLTRVIITVDVNFKVLSLKQTDKITIRTSLRIEPSIIPKCCVAILVAHAINATITSFTCIGTRSRE